MLTNIVIFFNYGFFPLTAKGCVSPSASVIRGRVNFVPTGGGDGDGDDRDGGCSVGGVPAGDGDAPERDGVGRGERE